VSKAEVHAILGELHKLLATYTSKDFVEASNYAGTSVRLRSALRQLAKETEPSPRNRARGSQPGSSHSRVRLLSPHNERNQVLNLIRRSKIYESTRSLIAYANQKGWRLSAKPKESKERLASRLCTLIEQLSDREKSDVISELLGGRNSQTQGWIDLITSEKP
jgi:hypothetical protein